MNLFDVYPLFNVNITKGEGCKVWDDKGKLSSPASSITY